MITILSSADAEMALSRAKKMIAKDFPVRDETNYVSFNMTMTPVAELAEECEFLPLGADKKCVLAENCFFLAKSKTKPKLQKDDSLDGLLAFCKNPSEFVDLYLLVYGEVDPKNEIVHAVANTGSVKEIPIPEPKDWIEYAQKYLKAHSGGIEADAANELVRRVGGDYGRFMGELHKLENYGNGEPISLKAIRMLVAPKLEDDAFELSNHLLKGNVGWALRVYRELKIRGTDEIRLINMLANQFRFLDMVRLLDAKGYTSRDIAAELKEKPWRVEFGLRNLYSIKPDSIPRILEELYLCEKSILSGEVDAGFAFESFIVNYQA